MVARVPEFVAAVAVLVITARRCEGSAYARHRLWVVRWGLIAGAGIMPLVFALRHIRVLERAAAGE